jgi:transposase-like protein
MSNSESPARRKWREVIERRQASGLSVTAFCRHNGVAASSFFAWKRKLAASPAGTVPGFVEATISPIRCSAGSIQVRLRGGRRLLVGRGFDRHLLAEVVAFFEGLS